MKQDINPDLREIFDDSPIDIVQEFELPSRGIFYPSKISKIKLRPLVFEDEKLILQAKKARTDTVDSLLASCLQEVPPDFVSNLVIIDKIFLVIKLREISFGKHLRSTIQCPNCGEVFEVNINIEEIPTKYFDSDLSYLTLTLPKLRKEVKLKVCRNKDHKFHDFTGHGMYAELYKFIESLAGKTETLILSEAVKRLSAIDAQTILGRVMLEGYGVDPKFEYACEGEGGCGYKGLLSIPIDEDFFSVKSVGSEEI